MQEDKQKTDFVLKVDTATVGSVAMPQNSPKPIDPSVDQSVVSEPAVVQLPPKAKKNNGE